MTTLAETNVFGRLEDAANLVYSDVLQGSLRYPVNKAREAVVLAASYPYPNGTVLAQTAAHDTWLASIRSQLISFQQNGAMGCTAYARTFLLYM